MKKLLFPLLFLALAGIVNGQKLPFQGKLTSGGLPVTGSRTFVFSISSIEWSETHQGVAVLDGYYAVVLGSNNPLPSGLFDAATDRSLNISVDGTALSAVTIYAPLTKTQTQAQIEELKYTGSQGGDANGLLITHAIDAGVSTQTQALNVIVTGTGNGSGDIVGAFVQTSSGNRLYNTGLWSRAIGNGNGQAGSENYGIYGEAVNNTISNVGTSGVAYGTSQKNVGIYGQAYGGTQNWAGWFDGNMNVQGEIYVNGQPLASGSGEPMSLDTISSKEIRVVNTAGAPKAHLSQVNQAGGLFLYDSSNRLGPILSANEAGGGRLHFVGADGKTWTWIQNSLAPTGEATGSMQVANVGAAGEYMAGSGMFGGYIYSDIKRDQNFYTIMDLGLRNAQDGTKASFVQMNSETRAIAGLGSALYLGMNESDLGYIQLNGGNDRNWDARAILSTDVNDLGTYGRLELLGPTGEVSNDVHAMTKIGVSHDPQGADPDNASAEMLLFGGGTPNIRMGGKTWEANNLGGFSIYGSKNDGGGWYLANLEMDVWQDEVYDAASFRMYNTENGLTHHTVDLSSNSHMNSGQMTFNSLDGSDFMNLNLTDLQFSGKAGIFTNNGLGRLTLGNGFQDYTALEIYDNNEGTQTAQLWLANNVDALDVNISGHGFVGIRDAGNYKAEMNISSGMGMISVNDGLESGGVFSGSGDLYMNSGVASISMGAANEDGLPYFYMTGNDGVNSPIDFKITDDGDGDYGRVIITNTAGSSHIYMTAATGDLDATGTVSANIIASSDGTIQTSDARLKTDVKTLETALAGARELRGVSYKWIDPTRNQNNQIGFIAQEVEAVFPEFVHTDVEGMKAVNYAQMVAVLLEAIKELDNKVTTLEQRNQVLESKLSPNTEMDQMKAEIDTIKAALLKLESTSSVLSDAR